MKQKTKYFIMFFLTSGIFVSCQKDDEPTVKKQGQLEFSFSNSDFGQSGSRTLEDEDIFGILVTLEDSEGNKIYSLEEIALYKLVGNFISKPISLEVGNYQLTEFFVINSAKEIVYATPLKNSKKGYLVKATLPISVVVNKDQVQKISNEVLSIAESNPADFGYSTFFDFDIVKTFDFLIGTFVFDETKENYALTESKITITSSSFTVFEGELAAITNTISLREDQDNFEVVISKSGYEDYYRSFSREELKLHFDSAGQGPLVVILHKPGAAQALVLQPDSAKGKDAMISYLRPDNNYGSIPDLFVYAGTVNGASNKNRVLLEFDLSNIPERAEIESAKISLFYNPTSTIPNPNNEYVHYGDNELVIQRVTAAWDEDAVTYNNQPSTSISNQVVVPKFTSSTQNYEDLNVTALVKDMLGDPGHSFGFMVKQYNEQPYRFTYFASSDHPNAELHPKLMITFK